VFQFDDSLDVIAVHLVGGIVGSLLLGLFADSAINPAVTNEGLFLGGGLNLLGDQFVASAATFSYSFVISLAIAVTIKRTIGLRVTPAQEDEGLDTALHAEEAYEL
jgi:Amt family ammonium transporter